MRFCETCRNPPEPGTSNQLCDKCSSAVQDALNICEKCNKTLTVGAWPWCPHEDARNFGEEPMEPTFDENVSQSGEYFTTQGQERRSFMAKNGLEYKDVSKKRRGRVYVVLGGK